MNALDERAGVFGRMRELGRWGPKFQRAEQVSRTGFQHNVVERNAGQRVEQRMPPSAAWQKSSSGGTLRVKEMQKSSGHKDAQGHQQGKSLRERISDVRRLESFSCWG